MRPILKSSRLTFTSPSLSAALEASLFFSLGVDSCFFDCWGCWESTLAECNCGWGWGWGSTKKNV